MPMTLARILQLFKHPDQLDRETLYALRTVLDSYPYFAAARILYLHNLYLLNDRSFRSELARVAFSINDRSMLFREIEGVRYAPVSAESARLSEKSAAASAEKPRNFSAEAQGLSEPAPQEVPASSSRTIDLINRFLAQQPDTSFLPLGYEGIAEQSPLLTAAEREAKPASEPLGAAAEASDSSAEVPAEEQVEPPSDVKEIDEESVPDKAEPSGEEAAALPQTAAAGEVTEALDESYFTETLAKIYVKQGRYEKALEIIKAISLKNPKKSAYFADQIRFLRKLIINSSK